MARTSSVPARTGKDRAGAARRLHEQLVVADLDPDIGEVVLVLEGQAKGGVRAGRDGHVTVVHAPADGDAEIVGRRTRRPRQARRSRS